MQIINPDNIGDFHVHSSTFSDGFNSIDELVIAAGKLEYQKIAITDHSQDLLDAYGLARKTHYDIISSGRWENIHNEVKVIFGIEADLLNEKGDICNQIQGHKPDFMILSAHKKVYSGELDKIKLAYLSAIERYGKRINLLGHFCNKQITNFLENEDIIEIVKLANSYEIAFEINCANLVYGKTDLEKLKLMLDNARLIYVNSDAHTMNELLSIRKEGFDYVEALINNH